LGRRDPGTFQIGAVVGKAGGWICQKAREFNAGQKLKPPDDLYRASVADCLEQIVLPPFDYAGSPWHNCDSLDPSAVGGSRFELLLDQDAWSVDGECGVLDLEAFVADSAGNVSYAGPLELESCQRAWLQAFDESRMGLMRSRMVYQLPCKLERGSYRILLRALDAKWFFIGGVQHKCDLPDAAASRWVEFTVD
jgi:hypothetical protein